MPLAGRNRQVPRSSSKIHHSTKIAQRYGVHDPGRTQPAKPVHPLQKCLPCLVGAEEMVEDRALGAERLLPARAALPDRIVEMGPETEQNVIRIENVAAKRVFAGPAEISAGYRFVLVDRALPSQQPEADGGIEQSLHGVAQRA